MARMFILVVAFFCCFNFNVLADSVKFSNNFLDTVETYQRQTENFDALLKEYQLKTPDRQNFLEISYQAIKKSKDEEDNPGFLKNMLVFWKTEIFGSGKNEFSTVERLAYLLITPILVSGVVIAIIFLSVYACRRRRYY